MDKITLRAMQRPPITDIWFAWFPVRLGALGSGKLAWMQRVWRNRCGGVKIYQPLDRPMPYRPAPCPNCGVEAVRGWVEWIDGEERFFVQHGEPICTTGSRRMEAFILDEWEVMVFRYWTYLHADSTESTNG